MTPWNPNLAATVICQQDCKPQMIILPQYVKHSGEKPPHCGPVFKYICHATTVLGRPERH